MKQTVYMLEQGKSAIIREVNATGAIRQRLLDMGMIPDMEVIKERTALGGDPVWVKVGSVQIALRKNEAESIVVEN
ncbi:MAG: ferrous iron transport protein A [Proteobacteria bacterium]|nr:ferrous iron transport protein A [Pseudomonadota bacterium]